MSTSKLSAAGVRGIPTRYAGTMFRSRLEARWAAFFDLVGWRWDYEPIDLSGWIPDFILHGADQRTLVEVKPVWSFPDPAARKAERALAAVGDNSEVLILGNGLFDDDFLGIACGWLGDRAFGGGCAPSWSPAPLTGRPKHNAGFFSSDGSFKCRMTGAYDGDHHLDPSASRDGTWRRLWKEAGNVTQWRRAV